MRRSILLVIFLAVAGAFTPPAFAAPVRLALLGIENQSANPRYDYLEGIVRGVLLYDLTSQPEVEMVTRSDLDAILREQELQLSALVSDPQAAARVGKLLGADYLVKGEYVALGSEVQVTVRLLDVAGGKALAFTERGASENLLHALAEKILQRLTGRQVVLQSEQKERSILSLQDEKPGKISLHSFLIDAEIFFDGEFIGYTTGNERVPFLIENVSPGKHTVRLHLRDFGVVREPEITFRDWEETVDVKSGKNHVVRANARHFNDIIYRLQQLLREEIPRAELEQKGSVRRERDASYTDRNGKRVTVLFKVEARRQDGKIEARATLAYNVREYPLSLTAAADEDKEIRLTVEAVDVTLEADSGDVGYEIWRNDIQQNMFR